MAHILNFSIDGLAGRDTTYAKKLHRDVNIFYGLNGSGKTSLLRIFHSAMSADASLLVNVPFERAAVTIHSVMFKRDFEYTIEAKDIIDSDARLYLKDRYWSRGTAPSSRAIQEAFQELQPWKVTPRPIYGTGEPKAGGWEHRYLPATRLLLHWSSTSRDRAESEEELDLRFEHALQQKWSEFFGEIQARVRGSQQQGLADILKSVLTITESAVEPSGTLDPDIAYEQIVSFLKRQNPQTPAPPREEFAQRYTASLLFRNVVERIDRVENEIDAAMQPRNQLAVLVQTLFSGNKSVTFGPANIGVTANEKDIGLRALSSGEKHILSIFLEAIKANRSSLIIDEPEMSLHLDWQRSLISSMRELNSKSQIIVATHSPEVMADYDESRIFEI